MTRGTLRALLLITAAFILAAGTISAQFANAIVKAGFLSAGTSGVIPPAPSEANPHLVIIATAAILAATALFAYSRD